MNKVLGIICVSASFAFTGMVLAQSSNAVLEKNGVYSLSIPLIDYMGETGVYQNAIFEANESATVWTLVDIDEALLISTVSSVEVIKTSELPIQVFLKVEGHFGSGCVRLGRVTTVIEENNFEISLFYDPLTIPPKGPEICTTAAPPFTKLVKLPVYGLEAGTYSFVVNKKLNGSFDIAETNTLPE